VNHELAAALITSLLSSTGGVGVWQWWLTRRQHERERIQNEREKVRDKQAEDSQNWYQQSRNHYEIAVQETLQAKKECADCVAALRNTRNAVYVLLEELEDQIIPMLGLPGEDVVATRKAMRLAVHKAREAL
jgi:hypothetical protein